VMKDARVVFEYYTVPSSLCVFSCVASTMRPGDKGMCNISSCHHCSNISILRYLGGVQVGYNHIKTSERDTGRISLQAVPKAEVTTIHHLCPTNIVYCRHKHSDITTELLHIIRQQEFLAHFKTHCQKYFTLSPPNTVYFIIVSFSAETMFTFFVKHFQKFSKLVHSELCCSVRV